MIAKSEIWWNFEDCEVNLKNGLLEFFEFFLSRDLILARFIRYRQVIANITRTLRRLSSSGILSREARKSAAYIWWEPPDFKASDYHHARDENSAYVDQLIRR